MNREDIEREYRSYRPTMAQLEHGLSVVRGVRGLRIQAGALNEMLHDATANLDPGAMSQLVVGLEIMGETVAELLTALSATAVFTENGHAKS